MTSDQWVTGDEWCDMWQVTSDFKWHDKPEQGSKAKTKTKDRLRPQAPKGTGHVHNDQWPGSRGRTGQWQWHVTDKVESRSQGQGLESWISNLEPKNQEPSKSKSSSAGSRQQGQGPARAGGQQPANKQVVTSWLMTSTCDMWLDSWLVNQINVSVNAMPKSMSMSERDWVSWLVTRLD